MRTVLKVFGAIRQWHTNNLDGVIAGLGMGMTLVSIALLAGPIWALLTAGLALLALGTLVIE